MACCDGGFTRWKSIGCLHMPLELRRVNFPLLAGLSVEMSDDTRPVGKSATVHENEDA